MLLLTTVRRARQRQLVVGQPEPIRGAAFHERQGLQQFHRRAREDGSVDVAHAGEHGAVGVEHRKRAAMA